MKKMSKEIKQALTQLESHAVRQQEIMDKLAKAHPTWNFVTLHVMSGDMETSERVDVEYQKGALDFETALNLLGSYARWDFVVREMQKGVISIYDFHSKMCSWWSAADPDDTEDSTLRLFKDAKATNGKYKTDEDKNLPETEFLTIYRGQDDPKDKIGFAWTLDYHVAAKFAKGAWARCPRHGVVITGLCKREDVLAYITGRGEQEIIIDPKLVQIVSVSDSL